MRRRMDTSAPAKSLTSWFRRPPGRAAPFLPMSRAEMDALGWDACDIVLVTGDAYVDHPSFGMAIIGRLLEAQGFRVGIIAQPDWQSAEPFKALGQPKLFFGVTGGNMDSMVNRYTSDRRLRHNDSYTPGGEGGKRPDRCTHRLRAALPRGLQGRADRARRHRGVAAPHRALRLLVRQGAPLGPGRRQGRPPALRQRRARRGRGGASPRRRRSAARLRRHPRRRAVPPACRKATPNCTPTTSTPPTRARSAERGDDRDPAAVLRAGRRTIARPMRAPRACCIARAIPAMRARWCSATATATCG